MSLASMFKTCLTGANCTKKITSFTKPNVIFIWAEVTGSSLSHRGELVFVPGSLCFRLVVSSFGLWCLYSVSLLLEERSCCEGKQQMWAQINGRLDDELWREHRDSANVNLPLESLLPTTCFWDNLFFLLNLPEELSSNTVEYTNESFLSGVTQEMLSCWLKTGNSVYLKRFPINPSFLAHSDLWESRHWKRDHLKLIKSYKRCQFKPHKAADETQRRRFLRNRLQKDKNHPGIFQPAGQRRRFILWGLRGPPPTCPVS